MDAIDVPARPAQNPPGAPVRGTSLAAFASEHTVSLTRFAYLLCGDRGIAEDLVQDAFVALYRRFGDELAVDAPVAYARRTIVNATVSRRRRRSSTEIVLADLPESPAPDAGRPDQDAMWHAMAVLPARQRTVLVLRYYLDVPDREIGALLDCREGTVRSLAARAFAALRGRPELRRGPDGPARPNPDHPRDDR